MLICIMLDPPLVELGLGCIVKIKAGTPNFVADPGVGCQENEHPYVLSYSISSIHVYSCPLKGWIANPVNYDKSIWQMGYLSMFTTSDQWINYSKTL